MKSTGIKDVMLKTKTVAAATTLVAGLGLATNVHADDVTDSTATATQTATENTEVTQSDVDSAKTALDTANQAVSNQEAVVQDQAKEADNAQAAYDDAEQATADAQELANQATPDAINQAQSDVTEANTAISKAQDLQKQAETNQTVAENAYASQQEAVNTAKADVTAAQNDVTQAQADVAQNQAILDGTGSQEVLNEQTAAQANQAEKETAVQTAQTELTKAQEADNARNDAIHQAQEASGNAQIDVANQKANLDAKQVAAQSTTQALDKAKADCTTAENAYNSINTITLSKEYVDALKTYNDIHATAEESKQAAATLKSESVKLHELNNYKRNLNDGSELDEILHKTKVYDINNLPDTVKQELSLFGSDLINQIREAFGAPETVVTSSSLKFADLVASEYSKDNWGIFDGHDAKAINAAARGLGLVTTNATEEANGEQYYENAANSGAKFGSAVSMYTLKASIYDAIVRFMFPVKGVIEYLHASSISGLNTLFWSDVNKENITDEFVGISFSDVRDGSMVHVLTVNPAYFVKGNTTFDTTPIANPYSSDKIIAAYNTAKTALDTAQTQSNTANQELAAAQSAYDTAVTNFNKAQANLAQVVARPILTPAAKTNLANAQTALAQAQERLAKANEAVASLNADVKEKQANLAQAKQLLANKEATLKTKDSVLATAQAKLGSLSTDLATAKLHVAEAKANVDKAKATYETAKANLAKLQNAPQALKEAQANLATAKTALLAKLDTLKASLETLQALKDKQTAAQAAYDTVSAAYQKVLDAKEQARLKAEYDTLVAEGKQPIPVMDETGKITGYTVLAPEAPQSASTAQGQAVVEAKPATVTPTATKATASSVASTITKPTANSLPMTGDTTSTVAILFGTLLTLFGLVGVRKKETK